MNLLYLNKTIRSNSYSIVNKGNIGTQLILFPLIKLTSMIIALLDLISNLKIASKTRSIIKLIIFE